MVLFLRENDDKTHDFYTYDKSLRFWGCTRFFRQPQTVQTETLWNFLTFNDIVDQTMGRLREENAKLRSQVMELQALRTAWNIGTICFFSHVVLSFLSENRWTWGKYPKILWCIIITPSKWPYFDGYPPFLDKTMWFLQETWWPKIIYWLNMGLLLSMIFNHQVVPIYGIWYHETRNWQSRKGV